MIEAHPDHEITEWLTRGFCMNDGDSTISVGSLSGRNTLNWQYSHFDDEDADDYNRWFGDGEELEFDDDW